MIVGPIDGNDDALTFTNEIAEDGFYDLTLISKGIDGERSIRLWRNSVYAVEQQLPIIKPAALCLFAGIGIRQMPYPEGDRDM